MRQLTTTQHNKSEAKPTDLFGSELPAQAEEPQNERAAGAARQAGRRIGRATR